VEKGMKFIDKKRSTYGGSFERHYINLYLIAAQSYQRSKKKQQAIEAYNNILKKDPTNIQVLKV
jgi:hypothetical protein